MAVSITCYVRVPKLGSQRYHQFSLEKFGSIQGLWSGRVGYLRTRLCMAFPMTPSSAMSDLSRRYRQLLMVAALLIRSVWWESKESANWIQGPRIRVCWVSMDVPLHASSVLSWRNSCLRKAGALSADNDHMRLYTLTSVQCMSGWGGTLINSCLLTRQPKSDAVMSSDWIISSNVVLLA